MQKNVLVNLISKVLLLFKHFLIIYIKKKEQRINVVK